MTCGSRGVGQYVASETHVLIWGRVAQRGARAIIVCPGSHSLADAFTATDPVGSVLAAAGYLVASLDMGQTVTQGTFGNDTARTRVGQLRTFVQGTSPLITGQAGKVHLMGGSGGAAAAINYARANPGNVASMYLEVPLVDVEDFYANWTNGGANGTGTGPSGVTQSEVNKAYNAGVDDGGTAYTAAMPAHNPYRSGNQAALAGIPLKLAYSDNDPYIPVSKVTGYAALVNAAGGSAVAYSQGAVGHTGLGVVAQDVLSFFLANP